MESIGLFLSLLGEGQSLVEIFDGSDPPDFTKLFDRLEQEITQVFRQDLADEAIRTASSVAQTSSDWLSVEYFNAVTNGQSKAQLWAMLDSSSDGPGLHELHVQAGIMESWASGKPDAIAQRTAALALTIHGLIVAIHRERSLKAPDPQTSASEAANMRDYARRAVKRVYPLVDSFKKARLASVSAAWQFSDLLIGIPYWIVQDTWLGDPPRASPYEGLTGGSSLFCAAAWDGYYLPKGPNPDAQTQINEVHAAYTRLLRTGADADAAALTRALNSPLSAFIGHSPGGTTTLKSAEIITNYLPGFQATGKWLAAAPPALQNLRKIAGVIDYEVAYQGVQGTLCTFGKDPPNDWLLGMASGAAPSIVSLPGGGYLMAFNASGGVGLFHAGTGGNRADNVPVAEGTSPVAVLLGDGTVRLHYQQPGGNLAAVTLVPDPYTLRLFADLKLGMMPGTSPDAALLTDGQIIVAFQANTGQLWTAGARAGPTVYGMARGIGPSVAAGTAGSYIIAFAGAADGILVSFDGSKLTAWGAQVAEGTSPSVAVSPDETFRIAFQGSDGMLWTAGPTGVLSTGEQMMPGTRPDICALEISGYELAFQNPAGEIIVTGDSGRASSGLRAHAGASPGIVSLRLLP
jgi:hypothetical protein